jgi:hypothetical protein
LNPSINVDCDELLDANQSGHGPFMHPESVAGNQLFGIADTQRSIGLPPRVMLGFD